MRRLLLLLLSSLVTRAAVCAEIERRVLDSEDMLPDGRRFAFWDDETVYAKDWHVAQTPNASDENDGSAAHPFRTVDRAARAVKPGERVVIHAGVYREEVRNITGGTAKDKMVLFEAAGDGEVVISGAEIWQPSFSPSAGFRETPATATDLFSDDPADLKCPYPGVNVVVAELPRAFFDGYNPFAVPNITLTGWTPGKKDGFSNAFAPLTRTRQQLRDHMKRRGLLFCDGELVEQVMAPNLLWLEPTCPKGLCFVEDGGLKVHYRSKCDGAVTGHVYEVAVRAQGFAPVRRGEGYVRIRGIVFDKFANGFTAPQHGAISTGAGHHWIIENCIVRHANGAGLDLADKSRYAWYRGEHGHHIVRNCQFLDCGYCAINGVPSGSRKLESCLIEGNRFIGCCRHNCDYSYEMSGIKTHSNRDCLYRRNLFLDVEHASGLWLDNRNVNNRITRNAFVNVKATLFGAVFIEASASTNLVDRNFICDVRKNPFCEGEIGQEGNAGGHGVYTHDGDNAAVCGNVIVGTEGCGVYLCRLFKDRKKSRVLEYGEQPFYTGNVVKGNLVANNMQGTVLFPQAEGNASEDNVFGPFSFGPLEFFVQEPRERMDLARWRELGFDRTTRRASHVEASVDGTRARLSVELYGKKIEREGDLTTREGFDRVMSALDDLYAKDVVWTCRDMAGWEQKSDPGKKVYIPFEGYYESRGGWVQAPQFPISASPDGTAFFSVSFTSKTPVDGYWYVNSRDANGTLLPGPCGHLRSSADWRRWDYTVTLQSGTTSGEFGFITKRSVAARDIVIRRLTAAEAAARGRELLKTLPPLHCTVPTACGETLKRTRQAVADGKCTIVFLGDSIQADTWNGNFAASLMEEFPDVNFKLHLSVRGSTGCWYYHEEKNFDEYVRKYNPDMVVIGGISNWNCRDGKPLEPLAQAEREMAETIERCQKLGIDVVVATPAPSYEFRADPDPKPFDLSLCACDDRFYLRFDYHRRVAERTGVELWNLTAAPCETIARSGKPLNWFKRDAAHLDEHGMALAAETMMAHLRVALMKKNTK